MQEDIYYRLVNNSIVFKGAKIGKDVVFGHNVVIYPEVIVDDKVFINDNTIVGQKPRNVSTSSIKVNKNYKKTFIGEGTVLGSNVIIYSGCQIGKECLIADLAAIREKCEIGDMTIIGRSCTIENNAKIGSFVKIETASHITGNILIEDHVFIGPHVTTTNDKYMGMRQNVVFKGPTIRLGTRVGGNATILPEVIIGKGCVVGAGAVVTKDIEDYSIAVGVPARVVGKATKYVIK